MVGDWMGSLYTVGGRRWDLFLFLDNDGRYERMVRLEPDFERRDAGRWEYDESERVLRLSSDTPEEADCKSGGWAVLSVGGCEDSNVLLVLREIILAGRNLPVLLSRVHCNGRGYGSGCEQGRAGERKRSGIDRKASSAQQVAAADATGRKRAGGEVSVPSEPEA